MSRYNGYSKTKGEGLMQTKVIAAVVVVIAAIVIAVIALRNKK